MQAACTSNDEALRAEIGQCELPFNILVHSTCISAVVLHMISSNSALDIDNKDHMRSSTNSCVQICSFTTVKYSCNLRAASNRVHIPIAAQ